MELRAGTRVDRYELIEPLGEGGQGSVWKAKDPLEPTRPVALKLVGVNVARPNDLERTRREARALARLSHQSLVSCHSLFEDLKLGVLGLSLELVDGTSLRKLMSDERFDAERRQIVLLHVARALAYLHREGIVHRDVKLDNVIVHQSFWASPEQPEAVKLVDLGIASVRDSGQQLTAVGTVIGTLSYLAPELLDPVTFDGDPAAAAVDVFAFGVMGWLLLTGRHPTGLAQSASVADYARAYRSAHEKTRTYPDGEPTGALGAVIGDALKLIQAERIQDGSELVARLEVPSAVVVRPPVSGGDVAHAPTSVASPRAMREATALDAGHASPTAPTMALSPVPAAPSKGGRGNAGWIALGVLVVAGGGGALLAMNLGETPATTPSARAPVSAPTKTASGAYTSDAGVLDAAHESAAAAAAEECADADVCSCCASGRLCGSPGCDAPLDPSDNWLLRVARAEREGDAGSLLDTHPSAIACLAIAGESKPATCVPLIELADGGVPPGLNVNHGDLVGRGVDVRVVLPLAGPDATSPLGWREAMRFDKLTRRALCDGLSVEIPADNRHVPLAKVVLWLDEPGATPPKRCR